MRNSIHEDGAILVEKVQAPLRMWGYLVLIAAVFMGLMTLLSGGYWFSSLLGTVFGFVAFGCTAMWDYSNRCWWVTREELVSGFPIVTWYRWRVELTNIHSVAVVNENATRLTRRLRPPLGAGLIKPLIRTHVVVTLTNPGKYGDTMILSTPRAEEFSDQLIAAIKDADRRTAQ